MIEHLTIDKLKELLGCNTEFEAGYVANVFELAEQLLATMQENAELKQKLVWGGDCVSPVDAVSYDELRAENAEYERLLTAAMQDKERLREALEKTYVHLSLNPTRAKGWNYCLNEAEKALQPNEVSDAV